jgi:hypothetical protein
MWLRTRESVSRFKRPYMDHDEYIEPNDNGSFQASDDLGEQLLEDDDFWCEEYGDDGGS